MKKFTCQDSVISFSGRTKMSKAKNYTSSYMIT